MRFQDSRSTPNVGFAIVVTLLLAATLAAQPAQAQKFRVLHSFHGKDGALPLSQLTRDTGGNLYGTTSEGGTGICSNYGCGTAFRLDRNGKQLWLHSFNSKDGRTPVAGLLRDATGNLYGTTLQGGDMTCFSQGCGTVFKLDKSGKETVLYKFTDTPDGWFPEAFLAEDAVGNLYGTASVGGAYGFGTVFKLDKTGMETTLYSFTCESDGCTPYPGVVRDSAGNLYGSAFYGGVAFGNSGYGVIFKLDTTDTLTVLHTFEGGGRGESRLRAALRLRAESLRHHSEWRQLGMWRYGLRRRV